MTKTVAELTPEQGIELALEILLEKGFESKYYKSWQEYAKDDFDEELDEEDEYYTGLSGLQGAWEALKSYVSKHVPFTRDGVTAIFEADQGDGLATGNSVYFVVLSLEDASGKRSFKQDGYYNSYEGGNLYSDTTAFEVDASEQTVTVWGRV